MNAPKIYKRHWSPECNELDPKVKEMRDYTGKGRRMCPFCGGVCEKTTHYTFLSDDPDQDEDLPAWECNNCGIVFERRVAKFRKADKPNKAQEALIVELKEKILGYHDEMSPRANEVKEETVKMAGFGNKVIWTLTIGMVDDEGTAASIYCRARYHILIGTRGGCTSMNADNKKHSRGTWNCIRSYRH